jgi:hypothetical protein
MLRFIVGVNFGIAVDKGKTSTGDSVAGTEVGVVDAREGISRNAGNSIARIYLRREALVLRG